MNIKTDKETLEDTANSHAAQLIISNSHATKPRNLENRTNKLVNNLKDFLQSVANNTIKNKRTICFVEIDDDLNPTITGCKGWVNSPKQREQYDGLYASDYSDEYTGENGNYMGYFVPSYVLKSKRLYGYNYALMLQLATDLDFIVRSEHYNVNYNDKDGNPVRENEPTYSKVLVMTTRGLLFAGIEATQTVDQFNQNLMDAQISAFKRIKKDKHKIIDFSSAPIEEFTKQTKMNTQDTSPDSDNDEELDNLINMVFTSTKSNADTPETSLDEMDEVINGKKPPKTETIFVDCDTDDVYVKLEKACPTDKKKMKQNFLKQKYQQTN